MPLVYLLLLILMMFAGAMLVQANPGPLTFAVGLHHARWTVQSSLLEVIGVSLLFGAAGMAVPYLRLAWQAARERRRLEQEAGLLRGDNTDLRRDVEHARSATRLMESRAAAAEELAVAAESRAARLEAELRPLLTLRRDGDDSAPPPGPATTPSGRHLASRWRRR